MINRLNESIILNPLLHPEAYSNPYSRISLDAYFIFPLWLNILIDVLFWVIIIYYMIFIKFIIAKHLTSYSIRRKIKILIISP